MFKGLKPITYAGREVWPLVEGGKGVAVSTGESAGAWAAAGGIGTVSAVNADSYDADGNIIPQIYHGKTRPLRHEELVEYGIAGGIAQVERAHEVAGGKGAINVNVLWEMGGAQRVLEGVLEATKGKVQGVTCGAGMPYKLSEIAAKHEVYYLPIISSGRAFRALWKRAYSKVPEWLGAAVYEDPWLAGGHNGLSNAEDPRDPQDPYPRVAELRKVMREGGIPDETPIVMAGGVWALKDWDNWIDNDELGQIMFQFGTRPLLTQESEIPPEWKAKLMDIQEGDVLLHRFSPTGFYSSAVRNPFLKSLEARSERQIPFTDSADETHTHKLDVGLKGNKNWFVTLEDLKKAREWVGLGFDVAMKTPDNTVIFERADIARQIQKDQADCMGCLSHCAFSAWKDHDDFTTGYNVDPRSFCIQKSLQNAVHGEPMDENLMFAGHGAYNFRRDPFYSNGFVPTVKQLVDRILSGE